LAARSWGVRLHGNVGAGVAGGVGDGMGRRLSTTFVGAGEGVGARNAVDCVTGLLPLLLLREEALLLFEDLREALLLFADALLDFDPPFFPPFDFPSFRSFSVAAISLERNSSR
jgi:hypothetical protein